MSRGCYSIGAALPAAAPAHAPVPPSSHGGIGGWLREHWGTAAVGVGVAAFLVVLGSSLKKSSERLLSISQASRARAKERYWEEHR